MDHAAKVKPKTGLAQLRLDRYGAVIDLLAAKASN